jgi:hypothetical protein
VWLESERYISPGKCPLFRSSGRQQLLILHGDLSSGDHNNGIEMIKFCLNQKTAKGTDACDSYCKQIIGGGWAGVAGTLLHHKAKISNKKLSKRDEMKS